MLQLLIVEPDLRQQAVFIANGMTASSPAEKALVRLIAHQVTKPQAIDSQLAVMSRIRTQVNVTDLKLVPQ